MSVSGRWMLDVQIDVGPHFFFIFCMKYLYIDESADEKYFVVGGILVDSEQDLFLAYNQFKKQITNTPMTRKQKERVTNEFKSTILEKSYPQIKRKMLYKLNTLNCKAIYCSTLLVDKLYEGYKEECYIELLTRIVKSINDDLTVIVFDSFGNKKLEKRIINKIEKIDNVERIISDYSFNNKGLQFADNVCGVIRKHLSKIDYENYYEIISRKVKKC